MNYIDIEHIYIPVYEKYKKTTLKTFTKFNVEVDTLFGIRIIFSREINVSEFREKIISLYNRELD